MTLLLKLLLQIFAVGVAALVGGLDYFWHDKRTRKFKYARKLLFLLSGLLLLISMAVTYFDYRENERQQEITFGNLTGGDSYCYLVPLPIEGDTISLTLAHEGKFPVFDTTINVVDTDKLETELNGKDLQDYLMVLQRSSQDYQVGTVVPKLAKNLGYIKLEGTTYKKYGVNIYTRYRTFSENIRLAKVNGEWLMAIRVFEEPREVGGGADSPRKLLKQMAPENFPKDTNGQINWN